MSVNYHRLPTERANPRSRNLDRLSPEEIVALMNREDRRAPAAVKSARRSIARAARLISRALRKGGRLFFVGAGASGRLGVLEAAECPPTFNSSPGQVQAIMAGGPPAVFQSKEGAEDSESEGRRMIRRAVRRGDVIVGIAASGVTPFVRAGLQQAKRQGATTIFVTCNPRLYSLSLHRERGRVRVRFVKFDVIIPLNVGPEIIAGSTRLKAGTACKMALNMLTTISFVQMGKVYDRWMVDLQPKSRKLVARGVKMIEHLGQVPPRRARRLFQESGGRVKTAIVMARRGWPRSRAASALQRQAGSLRKVIG